MEFDQRMTKRVLKIVFFIMLMDIVGMSILFPVAPYIVQRYSDDALMVTLLTVIYAGVNVALAGLMAMLGPLWAGAVYDNVSLNAPFWMSSIILLFACVLLSHVKARTQARSRSQQNIFSTAD